MSFKVSGSFKEMSDFIKNLESKVNNELPKLQQEMLDDAVRTAQLYYDDAIYSGTKFDTIQHDGEYVSMSGTTALFIEFGTGVTNPEHPIPEYQHGTYGQGRGANPKGWIYVGDKGNNPDNKLFGYTKAKGEKIRTKGEAAQQPMYKSYIECRDKGLEKLIEVLND